MSLHVATRRSLLYRPAAAGAWTPLDLASLGAWYDFSDAATLFTDAGSTTVSADDDLVYQVNDKSGNDLHMTQVTEALRPLWLTNQQNGLAILDFNGTRYLSRAGTILGNQASGFVMSVSNYRGPVSVEYNTVLAIADKDSDSYWYASTWESYNGGRRGPYIKFQNGGAELLVGSASHRTWAGYGIVGAGKLPTIGNDIRGVINGNAFFTIDSGTRYQWYNYVSANCDTSAIGMVPRATPIYGQLESIGEIIAIEPEPSVADINALGAYLGTKWGISWTAIA